MNIARTTFKLIGRSTLFRPMALSSNNWKDRDEAAEKVYITRKESTSCIYGKEKQWKSCLPKWKLKRKITKPMLRSSNEN